MTKIRGFAVLLITFGLIGGIALICGYQNKLISSIGTNLGGYYAICFIAIIGGIAIIFFTNRDYPVVGENKENKKKVQLEGSTLFEKPSKTLNCPCCGNNVRESDQFCRICGASLKGIKHNENKVVEKKYKSTCPFCGKTVDKDVSICPYCLRDIPRQDHNFGFDFQERQFEIVKIVTKWTGEPLLESTSSQLIALTLPLRELAFTLIDKGHPPGQETIKRNLDLGKLCAEEMGPFAVTAYCIGLEYGRTKEQVTPILDVSSVPQKVKDMAIVLINRITPLFIRLVDDINNVRKLDEHSRQKYIEECTTMGFGVFFACYKLGVATTANEI